MATNIDAQQIEEGLAAAAQEILDNVPRVKDRGYQGQVKFKKAVVVFIVTGDDGNEYSVDPPELYDGHPDLFFREYVRVGRQKETSLMSVLLKIIPLVIAPGAGVPTTGKPTGWLDMLSRLFR